MSNHVKSIMTSATDDRILRRKFKSKKVKGNAHELSFIKGPWSKVEKASVMAAVENYLKEKNIPEEDLCLLIHPKKLKSQYSSKNFFQDILDASKVNRSLDQLYWFMSRAYSNLDSHGERWTKEEDSQLKLLVQLKGHKWVEIENEMKRKDCKVRWEKISRSDLGFKSGRWSKEEEEKFIKGKKELEEKYNINNPNDFNAWSELALKVGTRSYMQCRNKFIHDVSTMDFNQEFKVRWSLEDEEILISRLIEHCSKASDVSEVIWKKIASKDWQPWTGAFLRKKWAKLASIITQHSPNPLTFSESLNYAKEHIKELTPTKYKHRDLLSIDDVNETCQVEKVWSFDDSSELISHLLTLFSNIKDESEISWESVKFSCWDADYLQSKWAEIKRILNVSDSMNFDAAVRFCQENITLLDEKESEQLANSNQLLSNENIAKETETIVDKCEIPVETVVSTIIQESFDGESEPLVRKRDYTDIDVNEGDGRNAKKIELDSTLKKKKRRDKKMKALLKKKLNALVQENSVKLKAEKDCNSETIKKQKKKKKKSKHKEE